MDDNQEPSDKDRGESKLSKEGLDNMPTKYALPIGQIIVLAIVGAVYLLVLVIKSCVS